MCGGDWRAKVYTYLGYGDYSPTPSLQEYGGQERASFESSGF